MKSLTRRNIVSALLASTALSASMGPLSAQTQPQGQSQNAARNKPAAPRTIFAHDDVVRRARELSETAYDATVPPLPAELEALDFDAWREIRFRGEKDPLGDPRQRFHLQAFHAGHLFPMPIRRILSITAKPVSRSRCPPISAMPGSVSIIRWVAQPPLTS